MFITSFLLDPEFRIHLATVYRPIAPSALAANSTAWTIFAALFPPFAHVYKVRCHGDSSRSFHIDATLNYVVSLHAIHMANALP